MLILGHQQKKEVGMESYSGTVKDIYYNGAVKIDVQGGPCAGEQLLGKALVQELTGPGVTLAEGDAITVEVENGKLVSIKKN